LRRVSSTRRDFLPYAQLHRSCAWRPDGDDVVDAEYREVE
jgi:hypothetical protein